ncbi:Serine protease [Phytophthora megakarya]|uniref:Serine protease n=1 Tax=Phytophthora megakarya TaxID=4795 RepID=A0A225VKH7_9STRA|nr:Serine protease [Phytophthora megakarya]
MDQRVPLGPAYDDVADTFLALSQEDEEIAARFKKKGLAGAIKRLIAQFNKNPESTCAVIINSQFNNTNACKSEPDSPSFVLRVTLGVMLFDSEMRKMIPPIVYRLNRCADEDLDVLKHFTQVNQNAITADAEDKNYQSPLLNIVIYYSEMWQMSRLSMAEIKKRYADVLISNIGLYSSMELYCTMEDSNPCNKFKSGKYDGTSILYDNDEYWNKRATIPTQASVLLLSSKLDEQTTNKYAEHLLNALKGNNKELIAFEHATQGTIVSTPLIPGDPKSPICGMELLVSYIKNGGNLERMDKSCVKKMPSLNMTIATGL